MAATLGVSGEGFAINYGCAGIGSEVMANRLGVGPMGNPDAVDLKFEEFFLSSWACGDPAMVVDVPANAPNATIGSPAEGQQINGNLKAEGPSSGHWQAEGNSVLPDDPSNVYHSYSRPGDLPRDEHGSGIVHATCTLISGCGLPTARRALPRFPDDQRGLRLQLGDSLRSNRI
jgi:hypothetical protein